MKRYLGALFIAVCILAVGCVVEPTNRANSNASVAALATPTATISPRRSARKLRRLRR